jgi:hypothetical protein
LMQVRSLMVNARSRIGTRFGLEFDEDTPSFMTTPGKENVELVRIVPVMLL